MEKATPVATTEQLNGDGNVVCGVPDIFRKKQHEILELPLLPVRNTVLLPNVVVPLQLGNHHARKAIEEAMSKDYTVFVVTQIHEKEEDPGPEDFYEIGVEGLI